MRVRFADTDAIGVVHHAKYLEYFEVGRIDTLRQIGTSYGNAVARGIHIVVVEAIVRYQVPARFDDVLLVAVQLGPKERARFSFDYVVRREADDMLIVSGRTTHACVDAVTLRAVRPPAWLLDDLRLLAPA